ncbi:MAG: hypothetical protein LBN37_05295, partial [Bacteroidales bacterium]|nr:hypothetical protein [Bacteroidales bacterium]
MKKLVCFFIACIFTYHTEARDYYVSVSGGGNGSSAASPANVDDLRMLLAAYTAADDRQLNIWFDAGTYEIPYQGFRFGADADAAARGGLNVVFQPLASIVTFNGYQGQYIKLLHLAEG